MQTGAGSISHFLLNKGASTKNQTQTQTQTHTQTQTQTHTQTQTQTQTQNQTTQESEASTLRQSIPTNPHVHASHHHSPKQIDQSPNTSIETDHIAASTSTNGGYGGVDGHRMASASTPANSRPPGSGQNWGKTSSSNKINAQKNKGAMWQYLNSRQNAPATDPPRHKSAQQLKNNGANVSTDANTSPPWNNNTLGDADQYPSPSWSKEDATSAQTYMVVGVQDNETDTHRHQNYAGSHQTAGMTVPKTQTQTQAGRCPVSERSNTEVTNVNLSNGSRTDIGTRDSSHDVMNMHTPEIVDANAKRYNGSRLGTHARDAGLCQTRESESIIYTTANHDHLEAVRDVKMVDLNSGENNSVDTRVSTQGSFFRAVKDDFGTKGNRLDACVSDFQYGMYVCMHACMHALKCGVYVPKRLRNVCTVRFPSPNKHMCTQMYVCMCMYILIFFTHQPQHHNLLYYASFQQIRTYTYAIGDALQSLMEMGFPDDEKTRYTLSTHHGDVRRSLDSLLGGSTAATSATGGGPAHSSLGKNAVSSKPAGSAAVCLCMCIHAWCICFLCMYFKVRKFYCGEREKERERERVCVCVCVYMCVCVCVYLCVYIYIYIYIYI
jgi:hypothetical protein